MFDFPAKQLEPSTNINVYMLLLTIMRSDYAHCSLLNCSRNKRTASKLSVKRRLNMNNSIFNSSPVRAGKTSLSC